MNLVSIYIIEHFLFDKPQTINFGGRIKYTFNLDSDNKEVIIESEINKNYIPNFFGDSIVNLSAIVGANGTGKTTILSIINKYKNTTKAIFVYDDGKDVPIIENRTGKIDENGNFTSENQITVYYNSNELSSIKNDDIPKLYYTSIPDIELNDFSTFLEINPKPNQTLTDYHFENIERNVMFLSSDLSIDLKSKDDEIPTYDKLFLFAKPLSKRDLRSVYGGFAKEGEIERLQKQALEDLWSQYEVIDENKRHLTNENLNFIKDVEVNILSFVIIDSTSMKTAYNGKSDVSFEDFIKEEKFENKLIGFLKQKIAYIDKYLFQRIKKQIETLDFETSLSLLNTIDFNKELNEKENRVLEELESIKINTLSSGSHLTNISTLLNSLEILINTEFNEEDFIYLREVLKRRLKNISSPISGTKDYLKKHLEKNIDEIKNGIKLNFESHRKNRKEIETQILSKSKQAIKLFSSIFNFYNVLIESSDKKGFYLNVGALIQNLKEADFQDFAKLIQAYREMVGVFNENSVISAQILTFKPSKRLSFGEKSMLNLFSTFYDFTLNKYGYLRKKKNYILLLDEADLGFHPLWKRKYVSKLINVLPDLFERLFVKLDRHPSIEEAEKENLSPNIQVIFTTHDPLALSDIPNYNVIYIRKDKGSKSTILDYSVEDLRPEKSFGANISDLISHSFFVEGGLVGDFASKKINETIDWLKIQNGKKTMTDYKINDDPEYHKKVIELIDEPIVRHKLRRMYIEATNDKDAIEKEIERLRSKIGR